jgi:hypothetical protein
VEEAVALIDQAHLELIYRLYDPASSGTLVVVVDDDDDDGDCLIDVQRDCVAYFFAILQFFLLV